MQTDTPRPRQVSLPLARLLTRIEKYGFSLAFLFFAGTALHHLLTEPTLRSVVDPSIDSIWDLGPVFIVQKLLLVAFNTFIGIGLLRNSEPKEYPERYSEIFYPMAGTFLAMIINFREFAAPILTRNLAPEGWHEGLAAAAIAVSVLGYAMSTWGIASLGKSFGALVAVRKVVIRGPYKLVRHPIYCGYLLETTGLILASFSLFSVIWAVLSVGIQIYRAILEERRLANASPEYREYQRKVGFILPRLSFPWPRPV
jgi:protein-S-isoprenylcysteine O-methyltransferase Ste14